MSKNAAQINLEASGGQNMKKVEQTPRMPMVENMSKSGRLAASFFGG
ncbi:hypothetical protein UIS43_14375 [Nocardiopsis sp. LDBS0036]|nr:hypothetical protein [Nocardiopsis dassonvillei]